MTKLFEPIQLNTKVQLQHRVVLAPCTRQRSPGHVPKLPLVKEYYEQRASVPGTLLITEATFVSPRAAGYPSIPGIWSEEQVTAWKEVTNAVHARGSYIYCQIWALGRAAIAEILSPQGFDLVSSSPVRLEGRSTPRALTESEIWDFVADFASAARNAIRAGFDGVEIHGANGYLIDQFTQDKVNSRSDKWGRSVENRARFGLEVAKAVSEAIGADRVGYRIAPFTTFQGMGMDDPIPQFEYLIRELSNIQLNYLHIVEPRVSGDQEVANVAHSIDFALAAWGKERLVVVAGGYEGDSARIAVDKLYRDYKVVISFGRYFISSPDLPFRLQNAIPPNPYDRSTFYEITGDISRGYTDYKFSDEFLEK